VIYGGILTVDFLSCARAQKEKRKEASNLLAGLAATATMTCCAVSWYGFSVYKVKVTSRRGQHINITL
jgi:hypothetical protein